MQRQRASKKIPSPGNEKLEVIGAKDSFLVCITIPGKFLYFGSLQLGSAYNSKHVANLAETWQALGKLTNSLANPRDYKSKSHGHLVVSSTLAVPTCRYKVRSGRKHIHFYKYTGFCHPSIAAETNIADYKDLLTLTHWKDSINSIDIPCKIPIPHNVQATYQPKKATTVNRVTKSFVSGSYPQKKSKQLKMELL